VQSATTCARRLILFLYQNHTIWLGLGLGLGLDTSTLSSEYLISDQERGLSSFVPLMPTQTPYV
jgi:hypothetical protein